MKELIKQPNGKYCSIGFNGEIHFDNYTEQDIINLYIDQAKKDLETAERCEKIIECLLFADRHNGGLVDEHRLKAMGFDKPYKELVKYIPREPTNTQYVGCDFATHGKCPNCGKGVQDGMGHKDEKCPACGQLLKWR